MSFEVRLARTWFIFTSWVSSFEKGFFVDAMPKALRKQSAEAAEQAKKEAEKREKAGMHRSIRVTKLYQIVSNSRKIPQQTLDFNLHL